MNLTLKGFLKEIYLKYNYKHKIVYFDLIMYLSVL